MIKLLGDKENQEFIATFLGIDLDLVNFVYSVEEIIEAL